MGGKWLFLSEDPWKMAVFEQLWLESDRQETIVHYSSLFKDVLSNWYTLKRGTFLVLEMTREYENSGDCTQMQGKYLPVIRRGILENGRFLSEDNDYYQRLWKDNQRQWLTLDDYRKTTDYWKTIDNHQRIIERLWLTIFDCLLGTFLVLENIRWGRNSGKWVRVQGKYLPVIRRVSLKDDGDCWKTVDYCQRIIERQRQRQRQRLIIENHRKIMTDHQRLWRLLGIIKDYGQRLKDHWKTMIGYFEDYLWLWRILWGSSSQLSQTACLFV